MIWLTRILAFLFGFIAALIVLFSVATSYGWDRIWPSIVGPSDLGPVSFKGLKKDKPSNEALVCPLDLCEPDSIDFASPQYGVPPQRLRALLLESLELEPRLDRVDDESDPMKLRFVQYSARMKFPDTISVEVLTGPRDTSYLAVFSRSQLGQSDLGVNRARIERWLDRLRTFEVSR